MLAELDDLGKLYFGTRYQLAIGNAARLLREMAADFEKHTDNPLSHVRGQDGSWCDQSDRVLSQMSERGCTCGLDAARAKWRIEK